MRVFLAGATGVIGSRLVPLLVDAGHDVTGMARSREKAASLGSAGAEPVVCDIFDAGALTEAVVGSEAHTVIHFVTDLPDDFSRIDDFQASNNRVRRVGTKNLIDACSAAGVDHLIGQSVAWELAGDSGAAVADLEDMVLAYPGVAIRYGHFYGPGTYYPEEAPPPPRIHLDEAARRTLTMLEADPGIVTFAED